MSINRKDRILIVDDSLTNLEVLTMILMVNYEVYTSRESSQALQMAKEKDIDLILLDIEMPGLNGYEVCRILKKDPETLNIPVIFVTSRTDALAEEEGLEAGAIDYVTKPFSPAIIKSRIKNHLKLKNYQDMLKELSMRDGLTGLYNKRRFAEKMEYEWARAVREKTTLSVLMIDIDYFKKFNDHYGHLEGDACLKLVAETISGSLEKPGHMAARFGGEEFACLLPATSRDEAIAISKKILKNIKRLHIPHEKSDVGEIVTISLGSATADRVDDSFSIPDLIGTADRFLYKAKVSGRNRICAGILKS